MQKLSCTLLVDDDSTTNYLNRRLLERLAVTERIFTALNGQEALDVLATNCPNGGADCPVLILLDVNMPLMNGFEFLEAYYQLPLAQQQSIIIVMLTTSLHLRDMQRVQELPVAGFLSKPLTAEKITGLLAQHFPGMQAAPATHPA